MTAAESQRSSAIFCHIYASPEAEIYALLAEDDRPARGDESGAAAYDDAGDPSPVPCWHEGTVMTVKLWPD